MKVTRPMIDRGVEAFREGESWSEREVVEMILRAALNDPKERACPLPGQTDLYDFLHERV
jgi:hypothetical protein